MGVVLMTRESLKKENSGHGSQYFHQNNQFSTINYNGDNLLINFLLFIVFFIMDTFVNIF